MKFASEQQVRDLADWAAQAAGGRGLVAAVEAVYAEFHALQAERNAQATCSGCGECCRFSQFGHCLFVTSPEVVHFLATWPTLPLQTRSDAAAAIASFASRCQPGESCPLQTSAACPIRAIRPLGCRVYFCEKTLLQWTRETYEQMQGRMRKLCESYSLPYAYVEWTSVLCHAAGQRLLAL